jgi:hypothetical protein
MATTTLSYKPKQVSKKLLNELSERALDVITNRFGLGTDAERKTLESIGQRYGITRERVRQIENSALSTLRKSESYTAHEAVFEELAGYIKKLGGVVAEDELLSAIAKDSETQNHIHFHLVLADQFHDHREDNNFKKRWSVDDATTLRVHNALANLYGNLSTEELLSENELITRFLKNIKDVAEDYRNDEIVRRYLRLSKQIDKNPLGEWGKSDSKNVKTRGVKDYAYLMMRNHGSPMHFREVAQSISKTFNKKCHSATCHNELIKDARFVIVGRGIYGLKEWGYKEGVVRDVIAEILKKEGAMTKEEVVDRVMKERYVKRNTILVNLQNPKYFKKNKEGKYSVAK